jgi:hypothetical protein
MAKRVSATTSRRDVIATDSTRRAIRSEHSRLTGVRLDDDDDIDEHRKDFEYLRRKRRQSEQRSTVWVGGLVAAVTTVVATAVTTLWNWFASHGGFGK